MSTRNSKRLTKGKSTEKTIPESEWEWHGSSVHFIGGIWCRFHLATEIGQYVVSTIGEYVPPSASGGSERVEAEWLDKNYPGENVGHNRKYETMVFRVIGHCTSDACGHCGLPSIGLDSLDFAAYATAGEATAGHMDMCHKVAENQDKFAKEE